MHSVCVSVIDEQSDWGELCPRPCDIFNYLTQRPGGPLNEYAGVCGA